MLWSMVQEMGREMVTVKVHGGTDRVKFLVDCWKGDGSLCSGRNETFCTYEDGTHAQSLMNLYSFLGCI